MRSAFTNILIPVDFSVNTERAIQHAISLIEPESSEIHLFHVHRSLAEFGTYQLNGHFSLPAFTATNHSEEIEAKFEQLKRIVRQSLPLVNVFTHVVRGGNIQQEIISKAQQLKPQLIIIGKHRNHQWLSFLNSVNTCFVARETNCAVLTVKRDALPDKIKSIVVPVRSFVPHRKLELLPALTRKQHPTVHLVALYNKNTSKANVFVDTYRTISDYLHYPVEYEMLTGNNLAKAILDYAKHIKADMILVNPYEETRINSLYGRHISDLIATGSKLSVVTAKPFQESVDEA